MERESSMGKIAGNIRKVRLALDFFDATGVYCCINWEDIESNSIPITAAVVLRVTQITLSQKKKKRF